MMSSLKWLFAAIFLFMIFATGWASFQQPIWEGGAVLREPWGQATLADAYCGFLTFFAWVAYKETSWVARIAWFILIMALGNIAMSAYVLWKIWKLPKGARAEDLLLQRPNQSMSRKSSQG